MVLLKDPEETGLIQLVQKRALSGEVAVGSDCSESAQTNYYSLYFSLKLFGLHTFIWRAPHFDLAEQENPLEN
jgi:hypothetical protein